MGLCKCGKCEKEQPWSETKRNKWDRHFLTLCREIAKMSKDRSSKVGCVIVRPDKSIAATGYNGFPRGIDDDKDARHERPTKYLYTCHAEKNAILTAARHGVRLEGCTVYTDEPPCPQCTCALIQLGITEIVFPEDNSFENDPEKVARKWDDVKAFGELTEEAKIKVRRIDMGQSSVESC